MAYFVNDRDRISIYHHRRCIQDVVRIDRRMLVRNYLGRTYNADQRIDFDYVEDEIDLFDVANRGRSHKRIRHFQAMIVDS